MAIDRTTLSLIEWLICLHCKNGSDEERNVETQKAPNLFPSFLTFHIFFQIFEVGKNSQFSLKLPKFSSLFDSWYNDSVGIYPDCSAFHSLTHLIKL